MRELDDWYKVSRDELRKKVSATDLIAQPKSNKIWGYNANSLLHYQLCDYLSPDKTPRCIAMK